MSVSAIVRDRLAVELCDQLRVTRAAASQAVLLLVDAGWNFSPPRAPLPSVDAIHESMLDAIHEERAGRRPAPDAVLHPRGADLDVRLSRRALESIVRAAIVVDEERRLDAVLSSLPCGCRDRLGPCQHEGTL